MNPCRFRQRSESRCCQGFRILVVAIFAAALPALGQDQPKSPNAAVEKAGNYVFKPVEIKPSPDGENYEGRFLFINKDSSPVKVFGSDEPIGEKFEPNYPSFQILKDGKWTKLEVGYCGTGAQQFAMKPGKEYQFYLGLWIYEEQDAPLTCKVGLEDFWSEPFVLDWKKDRSEGKFAKATSENFAKVRAQFAKAGFKKELLVGDDFCKRLLGAMMRETSTKDMGASFQPFAGKLDVIPWIGLDGKIRIDFQSDEARKYKTEYTAWFSLDPRNFSPEWFRKATKQHVEVIKLDGPISMDLDDGSSFRGPLYLNIKYEPFDKAKQPSKEDAEELFKRMLAAMDAWLE